MQHRSLLTERIFEELPEHLHRKLPRVLWNIINEYYFLTFIDLFHSLRDPVGIELREYGVKNNIVFYERSYIENEKQHRPRYGEINHWLFLYKNKIEDYSAGTKICKDLKTILEYFSNPRRNTLLEFGDKQDLETYLFLQKLYDKSRKLTTINIGRELQLAIHHAVTEKKPHVDLYELFKDFNQYPVATIPEYPEIIGNGDPSIRECMRMPFYMARVFMQGAMMMFVLHEFPVTKRFEETPVLIRFAHLYLMLSMQCGLAIYQDHKLFAQLLPNLTSGVGGRPVILRTIPQLLRDYAKYLGVFLLSTSTELLTEEKLGQKLLSLVNHVENTLALEMLPLKHRSYSVGASMLTLTSACVLGYVQYEKLNDVVGENPWVRIAASCLFPLLSVPRLLMNSHALIATVKQAKKNPREFIKPPRSEIGVSFWPSCVGNEYHYYSRPAILLLPLAYAMIGCAFDENWSTVFARMFFVVLSIASHYQRDYNYGTPRLFTLPRAPQNQIEHVARAQPGVHLSS